VLKTIHKSILGELIIAFLLTIAFLNAVLVMEKFLRLSKFLSGLGATAADLARIILLLQPQLLLLTIPMSLLLATLIVYGRMTIDSETVILKASGMDFIGIAMPVALLGAVGFLASCAVSFYIGPKSSIRLREQLTSIVSQRSALAIEEGTFNTSFKDIVIIVKGRKPPGIMEDIFIYDYRNRDEPKVLMAREGTVSPAEGFSIVLDLRNGYINMSGGRSATELYFDRYRLTLSLDLQAVAPKKIELTPLQLYTQAVQSDNAKARVAYFIEFHRRLSFPVVCLILIFIGPPLSSLSGKSGRLGGLALGLLVFTAYYVMLIYGENLVLASRLHHAAGSWGATAVFGSAAVVMFRRASLR
jgi:lipopolysaccharide export system permease protein